MKLMRWVDRFLTGRCDREETMEAKIKALEKPHKSLLNKSPCLAYTTNHRVKKPKQTGCMGEKL